MGRLRWLGLLAAVLVVGLAVWMLGDRPRTRREGTKTGERARPGEVASEPGRRGVPAGVDAREVTVAGDGAVRGRVLDEDGVAIEEGQLVLWCLGPDGTVARIRDGVLALDDEGAFEGPACRGRVCPELRHPSRIPAEAWLLQPGTEATLYTRMLPRLDGRVVDPRGAPVAGAQVVVTAPADEDPGALLPVVSASTSTDADGEFSLARLLRPPCDPCQEARDACPDEQLPVIERVVVTARAAGWAPGAREVDLLEAEDEASVEISLVAASASVTGRLVDAAGAPLPRAVVLARSEQRDHEQHRSEASDGQFAFDTLAEGTYTVRAIQDGIELTRREGVEPGQSLDLQLPETLRDVELRVVDEHGRPRPSVEVQGGPFGKQRTDDEGRVRAQQALPGTYILRLRAPGARATAYDLEIPAEATNAPIPVILR